MITIGGMSVLLEAIQAYSSHNGIERGSNFPIVIVKAIIGYGYLVQGKISDYDLAKLKQYFKLVNYRVDGQIEPVGGYENENRVE